MKTVILFRKYISYPLSCFYKAERYVQGKYHDCFVILMYHRITEKQQSETLLQEGMYVRPETFRRQILYLKDRFEVISLASVLSISRQKGNRKTRKPLCVITFDDGWKDFYKNAYPVLAEYNVNATVFLPTEYIGTKKRFWTDTLAEIMFQMDQLKFVKRRIVKSSNEIIEKIESRVGSTEYRLEEAVSTLKMLPNQAIENILCEMKERWNVDESTSVASFLDWEETREMYNSGTINFGSHTKNHRLLTTIPDDAVREELNLSRDRLLAEEVVSRSFIPLAYPNGNHDQRVVKLVEEAGYHLALTTEAGWNQFERTISHPYQLNRVGIHQDMTYTNAMLACRVYGYA